MSQAAPNLDFIRITPEPSSLQKFVTMLRKVYTNLVTNVINGHIGFGDGTKADNIDGVWSNVVAPVAPNTDFTITHNLGRIPVGYWVMQKDRACDVYTGSVAATKTQLTLRATVASAVLRLFVIGLLLSLASIAQAQTTTVTLQVTDAGSQVWFNGSWNVVLVSKPGAIPFGPPFNLASGGTVPNQTQSGSLDGTGSAVMTLTQNGAILPSQSQWRFTVCPAATAPCFTQAFTIAGATQTVSPVPAAISVSCGSGVTAYADSEVGCGVGGSYYQLNVVSSSATARVCQVSSGGVCSVWVNSGGGSGTTIVSSLPATPCTNGISVYLTTSSPAIGFYDCVNGVWQARPLPDPPVTQSYTLTTTGAQAGINLQTNAIDTHQLAWRPVGFTVSITDPFIYINGDLHGANNNWVNQTGSFSINYTNAALSNFILPAAYGSAASSFIFRSDGPTGVANEWAEEVVVEGQSSGIQNHGPCVYMSTVAESGYCLQLANNAFNVVKIVAGAITGLLTLSSTATGDIDAIQVSGASPATLTAYKNGVVIGTTTDSTFSSGSTGMFSAGNSNNNGATSFRSGTGPYPVCTVTLDSSVDGVTWVTGGVMASQNCSASGSQQTNVIANFVRVNLATFDGTSVQLVYSGRLAPASANLNTAPVSNGQAIKAGEVVWFQITSQGVGTIAVQSWVRILQPNGVVFNSGPLTVSNCNTGSAGTPGNGNTPGGVGYGFIVPVSGTLQAAVTQVNTPGFAQGSFYINQYLMYQMPSSALALGQNYTANVCTLALGTNNPNGILLSSAPVGSFYPMGFSGTTLNYISPWSIPGFNSAISLTNPAAGADFTFTENTSNNLNPRLCLTGISFTLTTSATVANRIVTLQVQQGASTGPLLVYSSGTAAVASQTVNYSFAPGAAANSVNTSGTTFYQTIPYNNGQPVCGDSGNNGQLKIFSLTAGLQAGDQFSNIKFWTQVQQDSN